MRVSETWAHQNSTELPGPSFQQPETVEDVHSSADWLDGFFTRDSSSIAREIGLVKSPSRSFAPMGCRLHCIPICATADEVDRAGSWIESRAQRSGLFVYRGCKAFERLANSRGTLALCLLRLWTSSNSIYCTQAPIPLLTLAHPV
jgi:hypothetical protein